MHVYWQKQIKKIFKKKKKKKREREKKNKKKQKKNECTQVPQRISIIIISEKIIGACM